VERKTFAAVAAVVRAVQVVSVPSVQVLHQELEQAVGLVESVGEAIKVYPSWAAEQVTV